MLKTIERTKIRDVVAAGIKSYIRDQNLKPGDRLPTENELASQFGVSRLSLREGTKALEFLGIITAKPGRGLTVGQVNMERVTEYLGFHPALQTSSREELIETRIVIETGVLEHVARRMRKDDQVYETLNEINGKLRRVRSIEQWVKLDIAFHHNLIQSSGLSPLLAFGDLLAVFFQTFRESVKRAEWPEGMESHQRMIDLLRAGQIQAARDELRTHINSHKHRMNGKR